MCLKNKLQFLQSIWRQRITQGHTSFDQKIYQKVKIVAGGEGTCEVEFQVDEEHTNPAGLLHGGFSACLIDSVSTLALLTHPRQVPGVSVNLNITYLKAAKIGDNILVKAATDKVGKNLAFLNVQIVNKQSGAILAQGSHTKYLV
ncbi:acyl-coenzyme A thioesterase 13-like [Daphnia pulex]|uniref:acyl-coenzyme A thioesterase 13-like n=1 Tax=Daphnia pulex TaxID=6669 RepID=UPI001EDDEA6F|nr:acyl-coenzyme A thioesterase 13-like [Daphnia pulex]XP_046649330.1 acyl-coenzyme A thioesterase 13-like [Daphnia pulicaria]